MPLHRRTWPKWGFLLSGLQIADSNGFCSRKSLGQGSPQGCSSQVARGNVLAAIGMRAKKAVEARAAGMLCPALASSWWKAGTSSAGCRRNRIEPGKLRMLERQSRFKRPHAIGRPMGRAEFSPGASLRTCLGGSFDHSSRTSLKAVAQTMTNCKQCGLPIRWVKAAGKWSCHNPDGEDHWDACSKARFDRISATGTAFYDELHDGYITPLKKNGIQFTRITAKDATGLKEVPTCDNCVPPWETCPNGCPIE